MRRSLIQKSQNPGIGACVGILEDPSQLCRVDAGALPNLSYLALTLWPFPRSLSSGVDNPPRKAQCSNGFRLSVKPIFRITVDMALFQSIEKGRNRKPSEEIPT